TKFVEHFSRIAHAINQEGLWDEADGFFYDRLRGGDGTKHVLRYRSLVGVIPLTAAITVEPRFGLSAETFQQRFAAHDERQRSEKIGLGDLIQMRSDAAGDRFLVSLTDLDQLRRILADVLDEESFLSPYGLRSLSRRHLDEPFRVEVDGVHAEVSYEPAESSS